MSRDGSGIYHIPAGTFPQYPDTTVESADWNSAFADLEQDANVARPIVAGGTGATTAAAARSNLAAERAMQVVTNYGSATFENGSFKSAPGATGAPSANAFAGTALVFDTNNIILNGYDLTTGQRWQRTKATTWGAWTETTVTNYVSKSGDTMTGALVLYGEPVAPLEAATKDYVDALAVVIGSSFLLAANNLSDVPDPADARSNLGIVPGTDVQSHSALLDDLAGISFAQGDIIYYNGTHLVHLSPGTNGYFLKTQGPGANPTWAALPAGGDMLAANNLSDLANKPTARTNLGLGSISTFPEATTAEYLADTAGKALSTDKVWAAADYVALTDAATIAVDMSTFINATVTLGGNRTLGAPSNTKNGQTGVIEIKQDGTGSRTLAYNSAWKFAGGTAPTLTTTASARDLLFYQVISSSVIYGTLVKDVK